MLDVLHLCREHGQAPAWWGTLDRTDRAMLLADLRYRNDLERKRGHPRGR